MKQLPLESENACSHIRDKAPGLLFAKYKLGSMLESFSKSDGNVGEAKEANKSSFVEFFLDALIGDSSELFEKALFGRKLSVSLGEANVSAPLVLFRSGCLER